MIQYIAFSSVSPSLTLVTRSTRQVKRYWNRSSLTPARSWSVQGDVSACLMEMAQIAHRLGPRGSALEALHLPMGKCTLAVRQAQPATAGIYASLIRNTLISSPRPAVGSSRTSKRFEKFSVRRPLYYCCNSRHRCSPLDFSLRISQPCRKYSLVRSALRDNCNASSPCRFRQRR
jgi:hypothetical protein